MHAAIHRSTIDRMKSPEPRMVFMSLALVGLGSLTGAFLDRLSFPHVANVFNTCASSRQFLVEFRVSGGVSQKERMLVRGEPFYQGTVTLTIDGKAMGELYGNISARRYLCEGNHEAKVTYKENGEPRERKVDFAVSRPSLLYVIHVSTVEEETADLQLLNYEPDDPRAVALNSRSEEKQQ